MTAHGLPAEKATALDNLAQNNGPTDGVSQTATAPPTSVLVTLAAAGRNILIPTQAGTDGSGDDDTCVVLRGRCRFPFGQSSVTLQSGQFAEFPSGPFSSLLRVLATWKSFWYGNSQSQAAEPRIGPATRTKSLPGGRPSNGPPSAIQPPSCYPVVNSVETTLFRPSMSAAASWDAYRFTVEGLADSEVCVGDHYRIGGAVFEVTQPRVTCYRVGKPMDEPRIAALLVAHHRPGFIRSRRPHGLLGSQVPEPAGARGSLRRPGALVLPDWSLPYLPVRVDFRVRDV
jgi:hypothetical protein